METERHGGREGEGDRVKKIGDKTYIVLVICHAGQSRSLLMIGRDIAASTRARISRCSCASCWLIVQGKIKSVGGDKGQFGDNQRRNSSSQRASHTKVEANCGR